MTITFNKTGSRTNSFLGDSYQSEYVFSTLSGLPIATFCYADFRGTIKVYDTVYKIEPVRSWTYKYSIHDENSLLGYMRVGPWFNRLRIELSTGKVFSLERRYKSLWDRLTGKNYCLQLQSGDQLVYYEFVKEASFDEGYSNARYRELSGRIDLDIDSLTVSLFGVFLIERLLGLEGD